MRTQHDKAEKRTQGHKMGNKEKESLNFSSIEYFL
jgi:hypothetical protein